MTDRAPAPADHDFIGVAGHPDDDECTHRADGTNATYCGLPEARHVDDAMVARLAENIASDAALVRVSQAEALRAAARCFLDDMAAAWGGDSQWLTTGTRVAEVVACVLREMAADLENECSHHWLDRPESDTRECLICGTEVAG